MSERLSSGALVRALEQIDGRLHYALLAGTGPASGWVSLRIGGRDLLRPASEDDDEPAEGPGPDFVPADRGPPPPFPTRQLVVPFPKALLGHSVRILEAACDARPAYFEIEEEEGLGALVWPMAYVAADQLLRRGVAGRTVLELGCGCGLTSLAARQAGAKAVLATDCSMLNLQLVLASAQNVPGVGHFAAELFDVEDKALLLPRAGQCHFGNHRMGPYAAECGAWLPERFDYVVMADVLYDPPCAEAFGARAAQAHAAGSTVILADPLRQWSSFQRGFVQEAAKLGLKTPKPKARSIQVPDGVDVWCAEDTYGEVESLNPSLFVLEPLPGTDASGNLPAQTTPARDLPAGRWQDSAKGGDWKPVGFEW